MWDCGEGVRYLSIRLAAVTKPDVFRLGKHFLMLQKIFNLFKTLDVNLFLALAVNLFKDSAQVTWEKGLEYMGIVGVPGRVEVPGREG